VIGGSSVAWMVFMELSQCLGVPLIGGMFCFIDG